MSNELLDNITVGEILYEEYMKPLGLTQNGLGKALGVPPRRINEIIHGRRSITLDTSIRLGRYFNQSPNFWLHLQIGCDMRNSADLIKRIEGDITPYTSMLQC